MNSTLLKLAFLGTDAQSSDFKLPVLEPFAERFATLKSSPARATLLAAGIDALVSELQTPQPDASLAELAQLKPIDRNAVMPLDVADEIVQALALYAESFCSFSDGVQETRLFPAEAMLRAVARFQRKIPPEAAAKFLRVIAQCDAKALDARLNLGSSVGNAATRDLTKKETRFQSACRLIPVFLEPYDHPQGVTLDELVAKLAPGGAINEREDALAALRYLAPQRARDAIAEFFKLEKPERRLRLLAAFDMRLELEDAPFLEEIVQQDRSNDVKTLAFDLLAKLRETAYASEITKVADAILPIEGAVALPEENAKLKKLGVFAFRTPPQKKREQAEERVVRALGRVPLEHWETTFKASPDEILAKLESQRDFPMVLNGFRAALALFNGPERWLAPLARIRECDRDHRKTIIWTLFGLKNIAPQEVELARETIDDAISRAKNASAEFRQALALTLAVYEPFPWRDSFAEFFDEVATRALCKNHQDLYQTVQESTQDFTVSFTSELALNAAASRNVGRYVVDLVVPVFPVMPQRLRVKYQLILRAVKRESFYYYDYVYRDPHPLIVEIKHGKGMKQIADSESLLESFERISRYFASLENSNE